MVAYLALVLVDALDCSVIGFGDDGGARLEQRVAGGQGAPAQLALDAAPRVHAAAVRVTVTGARETLVAERAFEWFGSRVLVQVELKQ